MAGSNNFDAFIFCVSFFVIVFPDLFRRSRFPNSKHPIVGKITFLETTESVTLVVESHYYSWIKYGHYFGLFYGKYLAKLDLDLIRDSQNIAAKAQVFIREIKSAMVRNINRSRKGQLFSIWSMIYPFWLKCAPEIVKEIFFRIKLELFPNHLDRIMGIIWWRRDFLRSVRAIARQIRILWHFIFCLFYLSKKWLF